MGKIDKTDRVVGICGIVLSMLYFAVLIPYGIGENANIGWLAHPLFSKADFVPKIWAGVLLLASIVVMVESSFKRTKAESPKNQKAENAGSMKIAGSICLLLAIMFGYTVLLSTLGFSISTVLGLSLTMWLFGYKKIVTILSASLIITGAMYLVFSKLLYVNFPGIFF